MSPGCSQALKQLHYSKNLQLESFGLVLCRFFSFTWNGAYRSQYWIIFTEMCFSESLFFCVEETVRNDPTELTAETAEEVSVVSLGPVREGPRGGFVC